MSNEKIEIRDFPEKYIRGAKRVNIEYANTLDDWFVGYGKDDYCQLEGTWWDMICLARNILASKNTELVAKEFYHPEMSNDNYCGEEIPYCFCENEDEA